MKAQEKKEINLTLSQIRDIIGFPLDSSAYQYREFWANCTAVRKPTAGWRQDIKL
ncbi:DUF7662 domain-containing protein [Anaerotignum sp.]